jgi:hypothetical protein
MIGRSIGTHKSNQGGATSQGPQCPTEMIKLQYNDLTSTSTASHGGFFAMNRLMATQKSGTNTVYSDSSQRTANLATRAMKGTVSGLRKYNYSDGAASTNAQGCAVGNNNTIRSHLARVRGGGTVAPKKKGALANPYKSGSAGQVGARRSGNRVVHAPLPTIEDEIASRIRWLQDRLPQCPIYGGWELCLVGEKETVSADLEAAGITKHEDYEDIVHLNVPPPIHGRSDRSRSAISFINRYASTSRMGFNCMRLGTHSLALISPGTAVLLQTYGYGTGPTWFGLRSYAWWTPHPAWGHDNRRSDPNACQNCGLTDGD